MLESLLNGHRGEYAADAASVDAILTVGARPVAENVDRVQLAAWTSIARVILNLHEVVTRN